jgi:esterase
VEITRTLERPGKDPVGYRLWRKSGARDVLVMIHGAASNLTRWSEFISHSSLKDSWNLLRMDLRGHGSSMSRRGIRIESWCEDLRAILDSEEFDRIVIIGHSLGAHVALYFRDTFPERVRAMILIDPVIPQNLSGKLRLARNLRWFLQLIVYGLRLLNALGLRRRSFPPRDLRELDERTRKVLAGDPGADIADLYTKPSIDMAYLPVANYIQDMIEVTRKLPPLEQIDIPVLVLLSAGATVSDPERNLAVIRRIPAVEIQSIDANHWLMTERPEEARKAIDGWCLKQESKG